MKKTTKSYEANFNFYLQKIWIDISDWVVERPGKSKIELKTEILQNFFPIEVYLDYEKGSLFNEEDHTFFINDQESSIDIDIAKKTIYVVIDAAVKRSCIKEFSEINYEKWCDKTGGFSMPALTFKIGEYEGDDGGHFEPIYEEQ